MWLYEKSPDNTARFVLGTKGKNPLICFGINPSTACPNALDATLRCVQRVSLENKEFDSYIMLNVYAQRATNPCDLHTNFLQELKNENERHIAGLIAGNAFMLWAAWGALIDKRPYLYTLFYDILTMPALQNCTWVSRGKPTQKGHPHHPLYVKKGTPLTLFDIKEYATLLKLSP